MGRNYAGTLGLLAFATTIARGIVEGGSGGATLGMACLYLFVFAGIGGILGSLAGRIVEESVRAKMNAEIEAYEAGHPEAGHPEAAQN